MPTLNELITTYRTYEDEKLYEIYTKKADYSAEAIHAMEIVLQEKGGIETIQQQYEQADAIRKESQRIAREARAQLMAGKTAQELYVTMTSTLLSSQRKNGIINDIELELIEQAEDESIQPETYINGVIGGLIGGTLTGILWGWIMVVSHKMFPLIVLGMAIICFGFVKTFAQKSQRNKAVVIITFGAVLYALFLGQIIYEIFGVEKIIY